LGLLADSNLEWHCYFYKIKSNWSYVFDLFWDWFKWKTKKKQLGPFILED